MNNFTKIVPITKVDAVNRTVSGILTAEVVDKSGEIMDYASTVPYYKAWSDEIHKASDGKSKGNLRAMHSSIAAGKITDIEYDDASKAIRITAKVVDDAEWNKVQEGVYTGFSQGGAYIKRWDDEQPGVKRYTADPVEASLVDNPCVKEATFEYVKADGSTEMRKFVEKVPEKKEADTNKADPEVTQGWQAKDQSFHATKAAALAKNAEIDATAMAAPANEALKQAEDALKEKEGEQAEETEPPAEKRQADPEIARKAVAEFLAKGLYEVSRCAELIQSLQWLQDCIAYEAEMESDGSALPGDLKGMIAGLCTFLVSLVEEETAELIGDADDLEAAAKLTDMQKTSVAAFVKDEAFKTLLTSPAEKVADPALTEALEKAEKAEADKTALQKALTDTTAGIADLVKRIDHLERQPADPKGVKTVLKGHEGPDSGLGDPVEAIIPKGVAISPEEARKAMKTALANKAAL